MTRGPLPQAQRRRRNQPTIATKQLPAAGRKGRAPKVPVPYKLGKAGKAWWAWAWKLPQATAWDEGAMYAIARRAQLEDDLAALEFGDTIDIALDELLMSDDQDQLLRHLQFVIRRLKSMAGGRVSVMKEMRELDKRLGIDPKALAELRWEIAEEAAEPEKKPKKSKRKVAAVDPKAA